MVTQTINHKASPIAPRKKYPAPQRPSIQELKQKYESQITEETKTPKPKSLNLGLLRKSKVKQMASMFNSKISQIIRRDTAVNRYSTLVNELSPEPKPAPEPQMKSILPKPLPLPRIRYTKEKAPVPSPRTKSKAKLQKKSICFVAEDVFGQLTVKDKALLYTQFVDDMSRKNPKFCKHAELIEAHVKKEVARGEVIHEKQESVKYLLEELEARCAFPKHTISPAALQKVISVKRQSRRRFPSHGTPVKSKEFEDIVEQKVSHISTLTVTLKHSPVEKKQRRARSLPRRKTEGDQLLFQDLGLDEPSQKRNNDEMRSVLPIEAYAPPKKIRRTRAERLAPQLFFQNQQLEDLFYSWLRERHTNEESQQNAASNVSEMDEEKQKSAIDKLLEEAIAKLENVEIIQKENQEVNEKGIDSKEVEIKPNALQRIHSIDSTSPKITPRKKKQAPLEPPKQCNKPMISSESSTTSSAKQSEAEESESGISNLIKITSDESPAENQEKSNEDFDFTKPSKPLRKKKMRRTLTWKKDSSLVEANAISTTDSENDSKKAKAPAHNKKTINKPQPLELKPFADEVLPDPGFVELDKSLMRVVNSPNKIKSAYTLTVFSPPPYNAEDLNDLDATLCQTRESSRSWPSLIEAQPEKDMSGVEKVTADLQEEQKPAEPRSLADSFDQGFETAASNEIDSPIRPARKTSSVKRQDKVNSPLFIKLATDSRRSSIDPAQKITENPSGFSTPIKKQGQQNFNHSGVQQQLFSPISLPLKNRRRSIYDNESRRSSLVMQVIREDHPLEHCDIQSPRTFNQTDVFFANAPTMDMTNDINGLNNDKTSSFWIKAGDFSISLDIYHNEAERVKLLYEIFSQRSCDTKDLHFGIDDHKFSVHDANEEETMSRRLPQKKETSHYWFSTGDLAIPFSGKMLTSEKIQRLFQFIKSSVEETGILRFGVDQVEFSNVPEFWSQSPKYSMESNYSMLVGLQSGNSNGLEGRSKYAWPHSKPVPVSDLDQSDFECEDFEENESARLSFSPFSSNVFDLASLGSEELMMPRNSDAMMMSPESFGMDYENEPLDQLFEDKHIQPEQTENEVIETPPATVPEMLNTLQTQQQRLSSVKERLSCYSNLANLSSGALDALKGTPEYLVQLKNIVSDISSLGCRNGFKDCTLDELERYMFFLSRYADICLNSCSSHMDKILDALLDHRAVTPPENELQKSHDHNPAALSEHQLRIQASLQRLNIPDWFRQYNQNQKSPEGAGAGAYKPGNFTRKRTQDSGRWVGLNSKTTSLSSLGSQRSDRSPLLLSPSAHSHHGGQSATAHGHHHQAHHHGAGGGGPAGTTGAGSGGAFSRWSTSHLNSSQTSPSVSQRGSFSRGGPINSSFISVNSGQSVIRNSMRQPYLGWRSQEKLSQRTAHERLASSLLAQQQRTSPTTNTPNTVNRKLQPVTPEIQTSIKEVTSAIVHYVNDQTNQQRSRSTSPNSRKCWLESSFVGIRPLDSPQTPVIENTPSFIAAAAAAAHAQSLGHHNYNSSNSSNNNFHIANHNIGAGNAAVVTASAFLNSSAPLTGNDLQQLTRMNGGLNNGPTSSSSGVGIGGVGVGGVVHYAVAPERSLSNASLEDVLASLLGLSPHPQQQITGANQPGSSSLATDAFARSSTGGVTVNEHKQQQQFMPQKPQHLLESNQQQQQQQQLLGISKEEQQRLRRRSEGDAPTKQKQQQQQQQQQLQQQQQQQQQLEQKLQHQTANAKAYASDTITTITNTHTQAGGTGSAGTANGHAGGIGSFLPPRRVSLGDSSESNNRTASASGELQIKCRNNKCDRTATPADAKKYYKSCHNCTYLYCSRECRRAHWEKHRKACLHSRVSNLCRQVLASCKDDSDSLRHLSLLARKGFLSQGRGVVRILFRSPESAEGFIKNGFQCMGEASYVRWPDLMPAEMGLELYSELLKLSTEYRPDSKMLVYVAVCVVSEAPSMGQAPVRWERQLVSRCAKLKLCKSVLAELDQTQPTILQQPITMVAVPEPTTEVLILTFNPQLRCSTAQREMVLSNILDILSRRGVILRKHYPEIFQRFQTYAEGQTDKINPVTLHPRDSHTGQNFVCIIMPVQSDTEIIKLPSMADGGNRVTTIDVGSPTALTQVEDNELLTRTSNSVIAS